MDEEEEYCEQGSSGEDEDECDRETESDDEEEDDEDDDDEDNKEEEDIEENYEEDGLDPGGRGPTEEAVAAQDEASSFMAHFPPEIEDSVIAMNNLEVDRRRSAIDGWKPMGRIEFRAYVGLLILAGMYRSRGEA